MMGEVGSGRRAFKVPGRSKTKKELEILAKPE